jgi:hypothetical protein
MGQLKVRGEAMAKFVMTVLLLAISAPAAAQVATARTPTPDDAVAALTAELRALRADLLETARASVRIQLLVARLQMQEQRIIHLDRQRTETAAKLAEAEQNRTMFASQMPPRIASGGFAMNIPPEERQQMEEAMKHATAMQKAQLAQIDATILRLQTDESQAASALAQEQGRWTDFSTRLEELERSLAGPPSRP